MAWDTNTQVPRSKLFHTVSLKANTSGFIPHVAPVILGAKLFSHFQRAFVSPVAPVSLVPWTNVDERGDRPSVGRCRKS